MTLEIVQSPLSQLDFCKKKCWLSVVDETLKTYMKRKKNCKRIFCYLEIPIFSKSRNQIMMIKNYIKEKIMTSQRFTVQKTDG